MCGIAGFLDYNRHSDEPVLSSMLETLSHRGPDGDGMYFAQTDRVQLGLGHKRLSIIDLHDTASQPMTFGSLKIVFNGEIYNYKEIKKSLEEEGHTFSTNSDTEVILHAFKEWGDKAVHHFIGMFAFVIYDEAAQNLKIYRDRAGVKPFYYYWQDGLFLFASELKAFHTHPNFKKEINSSALALYLKYCYVPAPYSIFENCFKLQPGYSLTFDMNKGTYGLTKYWDVNNAYRQSKLKIDEQEAIAETEKILQKAFEYRMVADVPVGVFLSGGYDSSAVAALLQQNRSQKIKTFTIGFEEEQYNEAPFAKSIANYLGTDHTEYYCTVSEAREILPTLPYFYDEPFGDSSAIPTMLVSKMARKDVTVALSADGGDEIFGGYNRYPIIQKLDRTFGRLPSFTRKAAYQASGWIDPERIPVLRNKKLIGQRYAKFRKLIFESNASQYLKSMCSVIDDQTLQRILLDQYHSVSTYFDEDNADIVDMLDRILAMDYKTYMVDDILTKVDRATMSMGLEGREPFLDQNIIEWVAKLPTDYKIRSGSKKYLLKEIVHKHIPKSMMDRPKAGFAIPIEDWFQQELSIYFDLYCDPMYLQKQGIFDYQSIQIWISKYKMGEKAYMTQLWNVLMFQLWYEKWMK